MYQAVHFDCARLSPDLKKLYYSLLVDGRPKVRCVNVADGKPVWEIDAGRDLAVSAMALSPDGKALALGTGYESGVIKVRNALTGEPLASLEGHTRWVCCLTFSNDGQLLASASADQTLRLWSASTWTEHSKLRGHSDEVHSVAFSPDNRLLATGGKEGAVLLWETISQQRAADRRVFSSQTVCTWSLPGGQAVVALDATGNWSIVNLTTLHETALPFASPNRIYLAEPDILGEFDGSEHLKLFSVQAHGLVPLGDLRVGPSFRGGFAVSPDRRLFAWGDGSRTLRLTTLHPPHQRIDLATDLDSVQPVNFSTDGRFLRALGEKGRTQTWDLKRRKTVRPDLIFANESADVERRVSPRNRPPVRDALDRFVPGRGVSNAAGSRDGNWLAISSEAGVVGLYDARSSTALHGHMQGVHGVAFSPDGRRLATSGGGDEAVKLWDVETKQELLTLSGKGSLLSAVEFAEDGNTLLVSPGDTPGFCQFWRVPSWAEIAAQESRATPQQGPR